jgi:hypothetical protein
MWQRGLNRIQQTLLITREKVLRRTCREIITVREQSYMSLVFENIDPPPPSPPGECVLPPPPPTKGGVFTLAGRRGRWGVNILEDERHRMPSYSNNLSTVVPYRTDAEFMNVQFR